MLDNNNLRIIPVISDSITRQGRAARLPLLATNQQPIDGGCAEGAKFAQDGRDWVSGSICQDLSSVQLSAHRKEEDAREETYP